MAAQVTINDRRVPGSRLQVQATLTGDISYPTGGYAAAAASFGLVGIDWIMPAMTAGGYMAVYNPTTGKVQFFTTPNGGGALSEVASAVDVHTETVELLIQGY